MFTLWFIVAIFVYSVHPDGAPPLSQTHLYAGEFTVEQCREKLERLVNRPHKAVKLVTGENPTWAQTTIIPGWACVPLQVVDE